MARYVTLGAAVGLLVLGAVMAWGGRAGPATAQVSGGTMQSMLMELDATRTRATVDFAQAVPRLGASVDVGEGLITFHRIGADMVCFLVPGNTANQVTCVPYTNVVGVIYEVNQ